MEEQNYEPFSKTLDVNASEYDTFSIEFSLLSKRTATRLQQNNIESIGKLLTLTPGDLLQIQGFGKGCLDEVIAYLTKQIQSISVKAARQILDAIDEENALYKIYNIDIEKYSKISISPLLFTSRAYNALRRNGIEELGDLLRIKESELKKMPCLGKKTMDEIIVVLRRYSSDESSTVECQTESKDIFHTHSIEIAQGNFSFIQDIPDSDQISDYIYKLKEAQAVLGEDLSMKCLDDTSQIQVIIEMFDGFVRGQQYKPAVEEQMVKIPLVRRKRKAVGYINAFTRDEQCRAALAVLYDDVASDSLQNIKYEEIKPGTYPCVIRFLKWCQFDLQANIDEIFEKICGNNRNLQILQYRLQKETLEQVGNRFKLTRERVRQLENKIKRQFIYQVSHKGIVSKINAEKDNVQIIPLTDLTDCIQDHLQETIYLFRNTEGTNYLYDKDMDALVIGGDSLHDRIIAFIETLPEIFNSSSVSGFYKDAKENFDLPEHVVDSAIAESYQKSGQTYHMSRLSLKDIYTEIIKRHYPEGIHAYDPDVIVEFRNFVKQDFGNVNVPTSDRALTARIAGCCILCGRGVYRLKQKEYIPQKLAKKIYDYIVRSKYTIFMINTIYTVFSQELLESGIDNKYYLQGVLHELFGENFTFTRDYISKDPTVTSIYASIVDFIRESSYPVSKEDIYKEFPGLPEISLNIAVEDPLILNFFGQYLHAVNLEITEDEIKYLREIMRQTLSDQKAHHASEFYDLIECDCPELLTRNYAQYPFSAFSILQYLFKGKYQFSRPYIAKNSVDIARPGERLQELIYSSDEFPVAEIREFARENHFIIQSMLEYILTYNNEFFLLNQETMVRISKLGITESIARSVDETIGKSIQTTLPISSLGCLNKLPAINVPWTDWLIFCTLKKWGNLTEVSTSSNQLKQAIPLVAPLGRLDLNSGKEFSLNSVEWVAADNLDMIDDLVADLLSEEDMGEEIWDSEI